MKVTPVTESHAKPRPRPRAGFTLIELLVVIAIIAVLIALLLRPCRRPARRPGGRSAPTTSSSSAWPCTTTTRRSTTLPARRPAAVRERHRRLRRDRLGPLERPVDAPALHGAESRSTTPCNFAVPNQGNAGSNTTAMQVTAITTVINAFLCPSSSPPIRRVPRRAPTNMQKNSPGNNYFASIGSCLNQYSGPYISGQEMGGRGVAQRDVRGLRPGHQDGRGAGRHQQHDRLQRVEDRRLQREPALGPGRDRRRRRVPPGSGRYQQNQTMPYGGAGLNLWLQMCAQQAPGTIGNANTNRSWIGQQWCTGMFGRTLGNVVVAPNSPYPNCATVIWAATSTAPTATSP